MSDDSQLPIVGAPKDEPPLKWWAVATLLTKQTREVEGGPVTTEWRLQQAKFQSEDAAGAEWLAEGVFKQDDQVPEGFVFNAASAMEIDG